MTQHDEVPGEELDDYDRDFEQVADGSGRPRRRLVSSGLVLLVAVVASAGWLAWSARRQAATAAQLTTLGAQVRYADELPFAKLYPPMSWLSQWLGHDWGAALVQVKLAGPKITDDDLACFEKLSDLRFVWLQQTAVGDRGLAHLKRCTNLEELYLAHTNVTDAGLAELANLKQLRFLSLGACPITDAGLEHLQGLNNLTRLDLPLTNVTPAGVANLQKHIPQTKIVFSARPANALHAANGGAKDQPINEPHQ